MNGLKTRKLVVLISFLSALILLAGCGGAAEEEEDALKFGDVLDNDPALVAVIASPFGIDSLDTAAFQERIDRLTEMFPQVMLDPSQVPTVKAGIVNQFVMDHLLTGEAEKRGISIEEAQVDQELTQLRMQFGSDSAFAASFGAEIGEEEIKDMIRRDLLPRLVLNDMMQEVESPTQEEVQAFADEQSRQVQAQHILFLVPEGTDSAGKDEIKSTGLAVLDSVLAGEDFATMARRYSEDPGSAQRGGDLGFFRRGEMVKPFEDAAFGLKENGDITDELVETSYGYHIIKLTDSRIEQVDSAYAQRLLVQMRQQEAQRENIRALKEQSEVRLNTTIVDPSLILRN